MPRRRRNRPSLPAILNSMPNPSRLKRKQLTRETIESSDIKNNLEAWVNVGNGPERLEFLGFDAGGIRVRKMGVTILVYLTDVNNMLDLEEGYGVLIKRSKNQTKRIRLSSNKIPQDMQSVVEDETCFDYVTNMFWQPVNWLDDTTWSQENQEWFVNGSETDIGIITTDSFSQGTLNNSFVESIHITFGYDFSEETQVMIGLYAVNWSSEFVFKFPEPTFPSGSGEKTLDFDINSMYSHSLDEGIYIDVYDHAQNITIKNIEFCFGEANTIIVPEVVEPADLGGSYFTLSPSLESTQFETIESENDTHVDTNWIVKDVSNNENIVVDENIGPTIVSSFPFNPENSPLEQGGQYIFNVRHKGQDSGWSDFSNDRSISIQDLTLSIFQSVPENGTSFDRKREDNIVFDANLAGIDVPITKLQVEVMDDNDVVVYDTGEVGGESVSVDTNNFDYGSNYKWRVRRYTDDLLWSNYSDNIDIYSHVLAEDPTILYTFEVEPGTTPAGDPADGTIVRSVADGTENIWDDANVAIGGRSSESVIKTNNGVFVVSDDDNIYAFDDAATLLWTYNKGTIGHVPIRYSEADNIVYVYGSQQTVVGLDSTGSEAFSANVPIPDYDPPLNARHDLLVDVINDRILLASNAAAAIFDLDGNEIWSITEPDSNQHDGFKGVFKSDDDNYLFVFSDSENGILKVDSNGNMLTSVYLDYQGFLGPASAHGLYLVDDILYIRTSNISSFDISDIDDRNTGETIPELFQVTRNEMFGDFSTVPTATDYSVTDMAVYDDGMLLVSARIDFNEGEFVGKNGAVIYIYRDTGKVYETVLYDKQIEAVEYSLETENPPA